MLGRQAIVLDVVPCRCGSAVRQQEAHNLTLKCFSPWRREAELGEVAERHIKLIVMSLLIFTLKSSCVDALYTGQRISQKMHDFKQKIISHKKYKCFTASLTKKPLPFRGYVHV
jgi:hypothetical protein